MNSSINRSEMQRSRGDPVVSSGGAANVHSPASYIYTLSPCRDLGLNLTSSIKCSCKVLQEPYEESSWSHIEGNLVLVETFKNVYIYTYLNADISSQNDKL